MLRPPPPDGLRDHTSTDDKDLPSLSLRPRVCHPATRAHARLLGPCFKTGRMGYRPVDERPRATTWGDAHRWQRRRLPRALHGQSTRAKARREGERPMKTLTPVQHRVRGCGPPTTPHHRSPKVPDVRSRRLTATHEPVLANFPRKVRLPAAPRPRAPSPRGDRKPHGRTTGGRLNPSGCLPVPSVYL